MQVVSPNNNARTMVDKEIFANHCAGVDINSCPAVGMLRHNSRYKRNILYIKFMGNAINENRIKPRVGENDFLFTLRRRVAIVARLHIL